MPSSPATLPTARASQPVLPVPHPSCSNAREQGSTRPMSAEEFWDRLGL